MRSKVVGLAPNAGHWTVDLADGTTHDAAFVVDACGRAATLTRRLGLSPTVLDRLVGCCLCTGSCSDDTEGLMIEAFESGWWYTAGVPNGGRVLVCMTDADLLRPLGLNSIDGMRRVLARTSFVRQVVNLDPVSGRPAIRPANSRFFADTTTLPFLAVGDAAQCYDPVSGMGILKGLRSGVLASYAIADWLLRGDASGLARYRLMLRREFENYRDTRREYYALERRWPDQPFWYRRHADLARDPSAHSAKMLDTA